MTMTTQSGEHNVHAQIGPLAQHQRGKSYMTFIRRSGGIATGQIMKIRESINLFHDDDNSELCT